MNAIAPRRPASAVMQNVYDLVAIAINECGAFDVTGASHAGEATGSALDKAADVFEERYDVTGYVNHDVYTMAYRELRARVEEVIKGS